MIKNITTLCISLFVSVYFFNFLLMSFNVFYKERLTPEYILQNAVTKAGLEWDPRKAGEVIVDLRKIGVNAAPNFTPIGTADHFKDLDFQALSGRSHATVVMCNEIGTWETYVSDRFGFNNDDSVHDNPHVKVALIGDSYVQGYCVPRTNTIGGHLNKNGILTINLGMSGNGYLSYLATFMEYIRPLRIETTVLVWFYNDLDDTQREYQYENLRYYLENENIKFLRNKQTEIDVVLDELINLNPYQNKNTSPESKLFKDENIHWQSYIRGLITLSGIRSTIRSAFGIEYRSTKTSKWDDETMTTFSIMKNVLEKMAKEAESWDGQIIVLILPPYGGTTPQFAMQIAEMKESMQEKMNVIIRDFEPTYKKHGEEKLYALSLNGTHFNEYGYCLFAKYVAELIESVQKSKALNGHFSDCKTEFPILPYN